jgi:hypothetical protein
MNMMNLQNKDLARLKDPKWYLENLVQIKTKEGGLHPFILNEAQKDLFNALNTHSRVIIIKARQLGMCQAPETRVLSSNLEWIKLEDLKIGDEVVAVDENAPGGKGLTRKMRTAIVEAKWDVFQPAFKIKMDDGRELVATKEHRYMSLQRGGSLVGWTEVKDLHPGDVIRSIVEPWEDKRTYEDGWFGGMIDGEGSLRFKNHWGAEVSVCQRLEGSVWLDMNLYLNERGFTTLNEFDYRIPKEGKKSKLGKLPLGKVVISRMNEVFRLLGMARPKRFIGIKWWEGKELPGKKTGVAWNHIVSITELPPQRMIDLQTSTHTYIAEGFVSHNSTAVAGYLYHKAIMNPGTNTVLIGYNSDLTMELLDKIKTFYRTTPEALRPRIQYNSKHEISFPEPIDSKIIILPSTENLGRGYTIHHCLVTELAFWDKADEKMLALEQDVPKGGLLVIESTPSNIGNLYHRIWMSENDYCKKEYGWWWGYTEEEIDVIRKRINDPQKFAQEYGLDFMSSGRPVFETDLVKKLRKDILRLGEKVTGEQGQITYVTKSLDGFVQYKQPIPDHTYTCGVDVSEGVAGGDYSVATIWDRANGEEVAIWRGESMAPDRFGSLLNKWGRIYNDALMVVEINNHGLTTVTALKNLLYPKLYFRPSTFDAIGNKWSDRLGWKTSRVTRPLMIDDFRQALHEGSLIIHSEETLNEMLTFVFDAGGNMIALDTFHDDCIFSSCIAFQGFKVMADPKNLGQTSLEGHFFQ